MQANDCVLSYNKADLTSKVTEEVATKNDENCRRQPHRRLTPTVRGTPRISAYPIYLQKLQSLVHIFAAESMGLSSFKF